MMKARIYGSVLATLLIFGSSLAAHAEDSTTAPAATSPPAASQSQAPPVSVARPSIVPKASEPPPSRDADAAPPRHRHAHRHYNRRYASLWAPFPIYLPHLYHRRIVWTRMSWVSF
jgi:hypothetical protein